MPLDNGGCVQDPNIVYFGCRPWEPVRDLSMGRQDQNTGLWTPGRDRLSQTCKVCGTTVEPGTYCEGCAVVCERDEKRLEVDYQCDIVREQERLRKEEEERNAQSFAERHHGHAAGHGRSPQAGSAA